MTAFSEAVWPCPKHDFSTYHCISFNLCSPTEDLWDWGNLLRHSSFPSSVINFPGKKFQPSFLIHCAVAQCGNSKMNNHLFSLVSLTMCVRYNLMIYFFLQHSLKFSQSLNLCISIPNFSFTLISFPLLFLMGLRRFYSLPPHLDLSNREWSLKH